MTVFPWAPGGFTCVLVQDAQSAVTANKTAHGSHSSAKSLTPHPFNSTCESMASAAGHFQWSLVFAT